MNHTLLVFLAGMLVLGCIQTGQTILPLPSQIPVPGNMGQAFAEYRLSTNTVISSVNLSEILPGGPGKDGIPAIRRPKFTSVSDASSTIRPDTLGIVVGVNTKKFYPYNILVWHEIVNDEADGKPVAVTFCPLCGSAIVFSRQVENTTLEFGVSGLLYQSNLLMYDHATESLWSQVRGEAIAGDYTGTKLQLVSSQIMNFSDFKSKYPAGIVLSTNTGYSRDYSFYPYGNYDTNSDIYFPIRKTDDRLPLKDIIYAIRVDGEVIIFPLQDLKDRANASLEVHGKHIAVESKNGELRSSVDGIEVPGYYAMYFSVVAQENNVTIWKK